MKIPSLTIFGGLVFAVLWCAFGADEQPVGGGFPPLLYATEGARAIQYYDKTGTVGWHHSADMARDVRLLPNGNILFPYNTNYNSSRPDNPSGVKEITPAGEVVFRYESTGQIFSCDRMADGTTVVGNASAGEIVLVHRNGVVTGSFRVKNSPGHSCMRHVRATPAGTILVAEESSCTVREYSVTGQMIREIPVPFPTFSALRLENGHTIVSGKSGVVEVDPAGQVVWQMKGEDFPELGVRWLAGFQVLENGDLLVCNANGKIPLFQVRRNGPAKIVWRCDPSAGPGLPFGHAIALAPGWKPAARQLPAQVTFPLALPGRPRELIFTTRTPSGDGHWYANFGYWGSNESRKLTGTRGRLCKLDLTTGSVTKWIEDLDGAIRDATVSYDGKVVLFSWRKGKSDAFHLFTCDATGNNIRQLTFGPWDDIEPCWLPDGGIIFVSTRSKRWVNCMNSQVATLFRCDADGHGITSLSGNIEQDNSPSVLPDGRIIYTRWEYIDRSQMVYHHLWSMNPDGTGQMVFYGNMRPGKLMIDAKAIPGSRNIVAAVSNGHGCHDHLGVICLISPEAGPDADSSLKPISKALRTGPKTSGPDEYFAKPFPLGDDQFLVGKGPNLLLMDGRGQLQTITTIDDSGSVMLEDAQPLAARTKPPVVPSRVDLSKTTGQLICQNVYFGRKMQGVRPGEIKKLLVLETLPKPVNFDGTPPPVTLSGTFSLERILGTVPVEPDGSANFEVPANRSIQLVALDEQNRSVKRMQSFLSVMPGEVNSCVGCHEDRGKAPATRSGRLAALQRAPSRIEPVAGVPEIFDFPRDIQPILDQHCIKCHNGTERAGGVELTGDRNPMYSMAYYNLMSRRQVFVGGDLEKSNYPPRTLGDSISPLAKIIQGEDFELVDGFSDSWTQWPRLVKKSASPHAGIHLPQDQIDKIRFWINSGGTYPGTYAALGPSGTIGWMTQNLLVNNIADIPSVAEAAHVVEKRCASCHAGARALPKTATDLINTRSCGRGSSGYEDSNYQEPAIRTFSRFRVYNLSRPEFSLMLMAPLAKPAGGLGTCAGPDGRPVFESKSDPDYQLILAAISATGKRLEDITRFDMPGFRPSRQWLREMKRYGILPASQSEADPVNPYEVEKRYFESLWFHPGQPAQLGPESADAEAGMTCQPINKP